MSTTTLRRRLVAAGARRRSAAELVLAYAVWGVGISLFFGPLSDIISDAGTTTVSLVVLVYPVLIQVPLAIHYDRVLGVTATPATRWRFVGTRFFHPLLVYGLFGVLWLLLISLAADLWRPLPSGSGLGALITLIVFVGLGLLVFLAYFPVVLTAALFLRWGQLAVRRLFGFDTASNQKPDTSSDSEADAPVDVDEPVADDAGEGKEPGGDSEESVAGDTTGASEASSVDLDQEHNVRFVSLLGLVLIPVGAGWVVGEPKFGMSVASLVLTVYQIAYNR